MEYTNESFLTDLNKKKITWYKKKLDRIIKLSILLSKPFCDCISEYI